MSTVSDPVQPASDFDPFQYFEGGKEGVLKRLGDTFNERLGRLPLRDLDALLSAAELEYAEISKLREGDYSGINSNIIQSLLGAFRLNSREYFGRMNLGNEREKLLQMTRTSGYRGVMGGSDEDDINLYLITEVLRKLD